jgi:hypothetical protein
MQILDAGKLISDKNDSTKLTPRNLLFISATAPFYGNITCA